LIACVVLTAGLKPRPFKAKSTILQREKYGQMLNSV
jgi:hypothetical protein